MKTIKLIIFLFIIVFILHNTSFIIESKNVVNNSQVEGHLKFNVIKINKNDMSFGVSETRPDTADFYINSNFFNNSSPIGLVVIDGIRYNKRKRGGGFFYVVNGTPHISSKTCPKMTQHASQTILWGIDNGVKNENLFDRTHANLKRYRTIMGENSEGQLIVVSSNRAGLVTIKEIVDYASDLGMIEGILLDGGTSVDYKFNDGTNEVSFQSVTDIIKKGMNIKQPTTYIYGNLKTIK
jgi:hypothetical protein